MSPRNLRHLRPGRFVVVHLTVVALALVVGLVSDALPLALAAAAFVGLIVHLGEQARLRARSATL